jgi:hypothetical protein
MEKKCPASGCPATATWAAALPSCGDPQPDFDQKLYKLKVFAVILAILEL